MAFAERPVNPAHLELRHYRRVEDGAGINRKLAFQVRFYVVEHP